MRDILHLRASISLLVAFSFALTFHNADEITYLFHRFPKSRDCLQERLLCHVPRTLRSSMQTRLHPGTSPRRPPHARSSQQAAAYGGASRALGRRGAQPSRHLKRMQGDGGGEAGLLDRLLSVASWKITSKGRRWLVCSDVAAWTVMLMLWCELGGGTVEGISMGTTWELLALASIIVTMDL